MKCDEVSFWTKISFKDEFLNLFLKPLFIQITVWYGDKPSHYILMKFCRNGLSFWSAIPFYALRKSLSFFRHSGHVLQWNWGGWNRVGHLSEKNLIQNFIKLTINYQFYYETNSFGNYLTANIFESGPMPTPWKFLDSLPVIPSC